MSLDKDRTKKKKENEKKIALSFLAELVPKIQTEIKSTDKSHKIGFGPKTLSIEQLVGEVEESTEEGKLIIEAINKYRLDLLKGKIEK